jgi:xanthine dehydrogenase accessory factor
VLKDIVLIRGGGDLASGIALRLHRSGMRVVITELDQPLVIRRLVSFAEAIFQGETCVEEVSARRVEDISEIQEAWSERVIPVLVDPECRLLKDLHADQSKEQISVLVDARMTKQPPELGIDSAPFVLGLGPGFNAGDNCHTVIETNRGHFLGRVIWKGRASDNTGVPEGFGGEFRNRVLRAPADGVFLPEREICDLLNPGDKIAEIDGQPIFAPFKGVLRGLLYPGLYVQQGFKVGDIDPRDDPRYCSLVSDKSLAIAGGVLEAILSFHHQQLDLGE